MKYIIHKKAFSYNDEAYEESDEMVGSIIGIFDTVKEAKKELKQANIKTIKDRKYDRVYEFYLYSKDFELISEKIKRFYKREFPNQLDRLIQSDEECYFPAQMNDEQANYLLELLDLSFHVILKYEDEEVANINPEDFKNLWEEELGEF